MARRAALQFDDDDVPTPVTLSNNSSFDANFMSMTKFVEYTNAKHDELATIHPAITQRLIKNASVCVIYILLCTTLTNI
jgi:hypothetical protein